MGNKAQDKPDDRRGTRELATMMNRVDEIDRKADDAVRQCEKKVRQAEKDLAAAKRRRQLVAARVAAALKSAGVEQAAAIAPRDMDLLELLDPIKGLAALVPGGASDQQIRDKLAKAWTSYAFPYDDENTGRGGERLAVWLRPKGHNPNPTLEGQKLIAEVRRVMGIPAPGKEGETGRRGEGEKKAAGKPASKPPKQPKFVQGAPRAGPGPKYRAQTLGQWMATVRGCLGKEGDQIAHGDPILVGLFKQKMRPADAARKWKGAPSATSAKADEPTVAPALERLHTFSADDLGLAPAALEGAMEGLRIFPAAPKFAETDCGRIGRPLYIERDGSESAWFAVVGASMRMDGALYTLRPLTGAVRFARVQWEERWKGRNGSPPEEIELAGIIVTDPAGKRWVLDDDRGVIYVRVPKSAQPTAGKSPAAAAAEHLTIPGTRAHNVKLTIHLERTPSGKFAAGFEVRRDGKQRKLAAAADSIEFAARSAAIVDACDRLSLWISDQTSKQTDPGKIAEGHALGRLVMDFAQEARRRGDAGTRGRGDNLTAKGAKNATNGDGEEAGAAEKDLVRA